MLGYRALVVLQQGVMPTFISGAAGFAQAVGHTYGLYRIVGLQFPLQIVTGNEITKSWVKRTDVVVLEIDLNKGFPVVIADMHFDMVEGIAGEIELAAWPHACQVSQHIAAVGFKQQTIPFLKRVVLQVQARVLLEMRCAQQLAFTRIGPAVQGTHHIAAHAACWVVQVASSFEHHGLAVTTDIGDELNTLRGMHQSPTLVFMGKRMKVA